MSARRNWSSPAGDSARGCGGDILCVDHATKRRPIRGLARPYRRLLCTAPPGCRSGWRRRGAPGSEPTSSPRCAVGAGRNCFDLGAMFLVPPATFSSVPQRSEDGFRAPRPFCGTTTTTSRSVSSELDAPPGWAPGAQSNDASNSEETDLEVGAKTAPQIS